MERRHFKLGRGYLNIDAHALIFTRSGNWREAEEAKERSPKQKLGRLPRILFGGVLVLLGGLFLSLGKLRDATSGGGIMLAVGLMGFGIYKMYQFLNDDLGPVYRIPFTKVEQLKYPEDHLEIDFLDASFRTQRVRVPVTLEAGICALEAWQLSRDNDRSPG